MRRFLLLFLAVATGMGCTRAQDAALTSYFQKLRTQQIKNMSGLGEHQADVTDRAPIAYVSMAEGRVAQLYTIQPDGANPRQLTQDQGYKCRPAWSVDHRQLAYFQYPGDRPLGDTVSVMILDDQGKVREFLSNRRVDTSVARLCWRPDGKVLYFVEKDFPTVLTGYDTATGQPADVVRLPKNAIMDRIFTLAYDMNTLAGEGPMKRTGPRHIRTIRRDGRGEMDLMAPFAKGEVHYGTPVWSYDSQLVAFDFDMTILVMSSAFRVDFKLYPLAPLDFAAQLSSPTFSPSGEKLACVMNKMKEGNVGSGDIEVTSNVWVMNINGSQQKQVTHSGTCFDPAW